MRNWRSEQIRNVALVGHGGSGKTTLVEALAHCAGVLSRVGRVEDGNTLSDYEPEELKRHISTCTSVVNLESEDHLLCVLDAPGYPDFLGEVAAALSACELAVIVVSATDGVQVGTELAFELAEQAGVARMFFVNKLDKERADYEGVVKELVERFGAGVAPIEMPIGSESSFEGVVDLLTDEAIVYVNGRPEHRPIPEGMAATEHTLRDQLVEGIVVGDDDLMERYLDGYVPSPAELEATLATGISKATVFPIVCGSAKSGIGIDRLAELIFEIGPSPLAGPPVSVLAGGSSHPVEPNQSGEPLAYVFKTISDPFVGKVSWLKVLSGHLRPDTNLVNTRSHAEERLHSIFAQRGREQLALTGATAGQIVAVAKAASLSTSDTLAPRSTPVVVQPRLSPPSPVYSIAVAPKSDGDEDKMMTGLHRLLEEDPSLSLTRTDETHQTILSGLGETHLMVATERLARKFGVEVRVEPIRVAYRETITVPAEAEGRYKKQTGGHGQFGVVTLRIEPLERGSGFEFIDAVVGGAIPRQFIPAVEKGVQEVMAAGRSPGVPIVDVRVTCLDGKHHPVDSSEMSFRAAGSLAFREAMSAARPVILEPISLVEVRVPSALQGDVLADLNARRGRILGTKAVSGSIQEISALVPSAEITRYAIDLRSLTGGRGWFVARHDHYSPMPPGMARPDQVSASSNHSR